MAKRYVLFWFDVEDCSVPQSDDATKRIAQILTRHGVRATMKVVGQKARVLRERVRYDVIDALDAHAIGYHSNWHGLRPQPAEYMAPLDWLEGGREFGRRERPGLADLRDLWGRDPVCYGQPGSNWSPQVFPVLRQWGIPTYVSGFGYVGLQAQPFYYGGIVSMSHMYGRDRAGREAHHAMGLNFELGQPGALEEHKQQFARCLEGLDEGGLISVMNHPCTLVLTEWFTTEMKPRELTEAGCEHFDAFVEHVLSHPDVETITAEQLPELYPDRAQGRVFSFDEIVALARAVGGGVCFQECDGMALSAAELFGMFARLLARAISEGAIPTGEVCRYLDGPALRFDGTDGRFAVPSDAFAESVLATATYLSREGRLPDAVVLGERRVCPDDYYVALAGAVARLADDGRLPDGIAIAPASNLLDQHVDRDAWQASQGGAMMRPGFTSPKLFEQAKLQAWTLKPAILVAR